MKVYAVIPARSGSKGLPNKNILPIAGKPLLAYSINFARSLPSVDRVICSTDSEEYANIARQYGAEVPFLRSTVSAVDTAMEEDVLRDLRLKFTLNNIEEPDLMIWLRPTFVFRSVQDVESCINLLKSDKTYSSSRTVVSAENRLYRIEGDRLIPTFDDGGKSMMRRQSMPSAYKVFSTDVLRYKGNDLSADFLGRKVFAVETNRLCGLDIDDQIDYLVVKNLVENSMDLVHEYL